MSKYELMKTNKSRKIPMKKETKNKLTRKRKNKRKSIN